MGMMDRLKTGILFKRGVWVVFFGVIPVFVVLLAIAILYGASKTAMWCLA